MVSGLFEFPSYTGHSPLLPENMIGILVDKPYSYEISNPMPVEINGQEAMFNPKSIEWETMSIKVDASKGNAVDAMVYYRNSPDAEWQAMGYVQKIEMTLDVNEPFPVVKVTLL